MTKYSHSRLSTFDNCPYQYKLKYIDKIKPEFETSIEAYMGEVVHAALEDLYTKVMWKQTPKKEDVLKFYEEYWAKKFPANVLVVNGEAEQYRVKGNTILGAFYERFYPFNQLEIIELETEELMSLPDGNLWHVKIDKLARDKQGNYYVIDYKTNSKMKDRFEIENDRQLAMYAIWVKNEFPDAKQVRLVWDMIVFGEQIMSRRTEEQLRDLVQETVVKISKIENAKEFPAKISGLCRYCGYKNTCEFYKNSQARG
jgi:putative RecB family exonuclease